MIIHIYIYNHKCIYIYIYIYYVILNHNKPYADPTSTSSNLHRSSLALVATDLPGAPGNLAAPSPPSASPRRRAGAPR